jgi:hypothetical protein
VGRLLLISAFLTFAQVAYAQDIPLVAPKKPKAGQASEAMSEQEIRAQAPKLGLILGPKIGGAFGVAGPLGISILIAAELGYRLPVLNRLLSISLEPSFSNPSTSRATELGTLKGPALAVSIPLLIGANVAAGPGLVRALLGPSFDWLQSQASVAGFEFNDTATALGATLAVSYLFNLGPGGLGVELRYHVTAPRVANQNAISHIIGISAAYVFDL